jgi:hypothetical protein
VTYPHAVPGLRVLLRPPLIRGALAENGNTFCKQRPYPLSDLVGVYPVLARKLINPFRFVAAFQANRGLNWAFDPLPLFDTRLSCIINVG